MTPEEEKMKIESAHNAFLSHLVQQPQIKNTQEGCMPKSNIDRKYTIQVYIDDGRIFEYDVSSINQVIAHAAEIIKNGYRHNDGTTIFEHYPPHKILKVKCER